MFLRTAIRVTCFKDIPNTLVERLGKAATIVMALLSWFARLINAMSVT